LSLGIFNRLWTLLEEACTELDLWHLAANSSNTGVDHCASALRKLSQLKARHDLEDHRAQLLKELVTYFSLQLPNPSTNAPFLLLRQEASKAALAVQKTVFKMTRDVIICEYCGAS
jgi:hypothetical protein